MMTVWLNLQIATVFNEPIDPLLVVLRVTTNRPIETEYWGQNDPDSSSLLNREYLSLNTGNDAICPVKRDFRGLLLLVVCGHD